MLHEGPAAAIYFVLPHYVEGATQFGVLHPDLTPRPAYVALAAVGRLLADARPLGRIKSKDAGVFGYLFRARPDGPARPSSAPGGLEERVVPPLRADAGRRSVTGIDHRPVGKREQPRVNRAEQGV